MRSRGTPRFWSGYRELPTEVRESARKAYAIFRVNPEHPGLRFKRVSEKEPVYSVRIGLGYRALCLFEGDEVTWFWIGSHADYDRLLKTT